MKELSIEEKAKRYDKAIEIAKDINNEQCAQPFNVMTRVFPELKEFGDERIKKNCIHFLELQMSHHAATFEIEECIAWLEKQGEQKPANKIEPKFKVGDIIRLKGTAAEYTIKKVTDTTYYTNGWSCGIERCEEDYELVEQKPWSEDDEKFFKTALWHISYSISNGKSTDFHCDTTNWLKSLKERYTWKPTDEQIKVCKEVYADLLSAKGFDLGTVNSELNRLEEELKKNRF